MTSRKCPRCSKRYTKYSAFVKHFYSAHYKSKAKTTKAKTGPWKAPKVHRARR